ncbi:MAG TPA: TonB family protein [Leadbetterella sp.]|nr:TonB family protein [Leadbetterella sp.]
MKNVENLDDIIFENRNKAYGAYFLRKNYNHYLTKAMVIGSSCFILLFGGAFTYNKYIENKNDGKLIRDVTLVISPPPVEPPIEIKEIEPPLPEKKTEPQATIAYLPPTPVDDNKDIIEMPPPPPDKMEGKIISNNTVDGTESDLLIPPAVAPEITKKIDLAETDESKIFIAVEQQPQFPYGDKELYKFLAKHIHYPESAVRANVSGKVYVKFVVETDGSIGNIQVTKGIGFGCDEEAERVVSLMPKWLPGKQNGKAVRVFYNMPIVYRLE